MPSTYRIQPGDTLGRLAARFYGSAARYPLLVTADRILNPDRLKVGQLLVIPDSSVAKVNGKPTPLAPKLATPSDHLHALNEERIAQLHPIVATRGRSLVDLAAHAGVAVPVPHQRSSADVGGVEYPLDVKWSCKSITGCPQPFT